MIYIAGFYPCSMSGWNRPVTKFPMENEDEQVIIEMPCSRDDLKRVGLMELIVSVKLFYCYFLSLEREITR